MTDELIQKKIEQVEQKIADIQQQIQDEELSWTEREATFQRQYTLELGTHKGRIEALEEQVVNMRQVIDILKKNDEPSPESGQSENQEENPETDDVSA